MTIFALTEMDSQAYPAFINVTEVTSGSFKLTVRERGNDGNKFVHIEINEQQVKEMALELLKRIDPGVAMNARLMLSGQMSED